MNIQKLTGWDIQTRRPVRIQWNESEVLSIESMPAREAGQRWLAPGLVDLQVNGFAGVDFQQDGITAEQLRQVVEALTAVGCTRFLLTLITDDWAAMLTRLESYRKLREADPNLRTAIAGWHLEGPFLSPEAGFHGAHPPEAMIDPTPEHIAAIQSVVGSTPTLLTLAPERPGSFETIRAAARAGFRVSLGHTNASQEAIQGAMQSGAQGFTHLGNGCPAKLDRHDNILWRVWDTPGLQVGLIPDTIHVAPALFRAMHRILPEDRLYYTTDAMAAAGAPPGRYTLGRLSLDVGRDQIVRQPGTGQLAGSALDPLEAVCRAARMLAIPWQTAWERLSTRPARWIGLPDGLTVGSPPSFCSVEVDSKNEITGLAICGGPAITMPRHVRLDREPPAQSKEAEE